MGIQERKQRQFAEREQGFLNGAWAMIQREGVLNLQMARLAADSDYAVGTLYQHFSSKEDLLVALATRTISQRIELFQRVAAWQAPSRSRIFAILVADALFSQREPTNFRLTQYVSTHAVWAAASPERREAALQASRPLGEAVQRVVEDAIRSGDVDNHGLTGRELCSGLWSMSVGMHALVNATGLLETECVPRAYQLMLLHGHALLNGLGWKPLISLDDTAVQHQLLEQIRLELFPEFPVATCAAVTEPLTSCSEEG